MSEPTAEYPEHDKLQKINHLSQAIHDFLEELEGKQVMLGRYVTIEGYREQQFQPISQQTADDLLAEHFGINMAVIEAEKRQMIERMRQLNESDSQE